MPIQVNPISRRNFLVAAGAAACGLMSNSALAAPAPTGGVETIALLSDIHLHSNPGADFRGNNMADHFQYVRNEVLAQSAAPSRVFINGDLAYHKGRPDDYRRVLDGLLPFRHAGMPVHLTLGNHDHRDNFRNTFPDPLADCCEGLDKQMSIVSTRNADWILLDSLDEVNARPGQVGEQQLHLLARQLDLRANRPCIVMVHHPPDDDRPITGLKDTRALLQTIVPRRQVKALMFGHSHRWAARQLGGMYLINLPAVAYPFSKDHPIGWVDCRLRDNGASLTLNAIDRGHSRHRETYALKWRA